MEALSDLSISVLAQRAAMVQTLLPKTRQHQAAWRKFTQHFEQVCRSMSDTPARSVKALSAQDLMSSGFRKAQ